MSIDLRHLTAFVAVAGGVVLRPLDRCDAEVLTVAAWHADNDSAALARFINVVRHAASG